MTAPQIIALTVLFVEWCAQAWMHDKPYKGRYDVRIATMNVLAVLALLVWGRFF